MNTSKNIILLSDGTGNSAAKRHKTNVWRLYNALDLHRKDQIAMYDAGVGTSQFLPFKLVGGMFGWGLKTNVLQLYKFLCRNYEDGDRIYLFGFSRGAFTVRLLTGLIAKCGVCTGFRSEQDLDKIARANYADYRKYSRYTLFGLLAGIWNCIRGKKQVSCSGVTSPEIQFIGVWDTVDAYGFPIDELACLFDRLILPIQFKGRQLSKIVVKACHALSIDDERRTFSPVMWDETAECNPYRIEQVWFPGVHSDVGGGYARRELALVSLDWMISKVAKKSKIGKGNNGLVFRHNVRKKYQRCCDWNGMQHDSRSGYRALYRYKPRDIERICRQGGTARTLPKIHRSVFERIRGTVVPYSPTGLPENYDIVVTRGSIPPFPPLPAILGYENLSAKKARISAMNHALDVVYWRHWLYRIFVMTTLLPVAVSILLIWEIFGHSTALACILEPLYRFFLFILSCFISEQNVVAWSQNTEFCIQVVLLLCFLLAYIAALIALKICAYKKTCNKAESAWSFVKRGVYPAPTLKRTITSRMRECSTCLADAVQKKFCRY